MGKNYHSHCFIDVCYWFHKLWLINTGLTSMPIYILSGLPKLFLYNCTGWFKRICALTIWKRKGRGRGVEGTDCCMNNEGAFLFNFHNEVMLVGSGYKDWSLRWALWEAALCEIKDRGEISFQKSSSSPVLCLAIPEKDHTAVKLSSYPADAKVMNYVLK